MGLLLLAALAGTVWWSVGRSLRSLERVADEAGGIDPARFSHRFPEVGMPRELAPICRRLNGLLERLEAAFDRERRFSADVAHELRTLAEVALCTSEGERSAPAWASPSRAATDSRCGCEFPPPPGPS